MDSIIILFSSSTSAVRVKEGLQRRGFSAKVIQTPSRLARGGCNYSVRAQAAAMAEAEKIIKTVGMRTRGIYLDTNAEGAARYRKLSEGINVDLSG